jgi:UV DNA damage endonuclease
MNRIGYACDNLSLPGITTGRTVKKATWQKKGLDVISECALQNVKDLKTVVQWNIDNGYTFFRIGSELIPWLDFYDITKLKDYNDIVKNLRQVGELASNNNVRLTFHPGQFCVLCSPSDDVVQRTINELNNHSMIFDLMGFTPSCYNKINIHIGGAYGDKQTTIDRWISNWHRLNDNTKKRLVIENDDKPSMYTVQDLMYVHTKIGIPITFDYFHHSLNPGTLTEQEALEMALSTWPKDITPATHYSESRRLEQQRIIKEIFEKNRIDYNELDTWPTFKSMHDEFQKIKITAHSDYIEREINTYGHTFDIMVEAKAKNLATDRYKEMFCKKQLLTN